MPSDRKEKTREAPSNLEEGTLEAPSNPDEETQEELLDPEETHKAPPNPAGETRKAQSDPGVETNDVAGLAAGSADLKAPVIPRVGSSPSAAIFRQIMATRTWSRRVHAGVKGAAPQSFLSTNVRSDEGRMSMCDGGGTMKFQRKVKLPESIAKGMSPEQ